MITPNGTGLVGANILPQLEQTIKREFDQALPKAFIASVNNQKAYYTFINGYRLIWRPLDDAGKLRSLNLDMIVFVEGSEINADFWSVAKTRLRNLAASILDEEQTNANRANFFRTHKRPPNPQEMQALTVYAADWREQWVESNPDAGWVKQEVFLPASRLYLAGDPLHKARTREANELTPLDPATSAHIASTSANAYLPRDYIQNLTRNKPQWWINRYVLSSFEYAEGLVFPAALTNARTDTSHILTEPPKPPNSARFLLAHDYGLSDPAGILLTYVDPEIRKLIVFKEYKNTNTHLTDLAHQIRNLASHAPPGTWLRPFIIDPKTGPKRDYQKKSLIDLYAEHNIHFQPASTPAVEPGIYKLNTYFEDDRILISPECPELIKELQAYSFRQSRDGSNQSQTEDKNNHLIDPLRWIVMELPADPTELSNAIFNSYGNRVLPSRDDLAYEYGFNASDPHRSREPEYTPHVIPNFLSPIENISDPYTENALQNPRGRGTMSPNYLWSPLDND